MRLSLLAIASTAMLALGMIVLSANAGSIDDTDSDLIPDVFDNCSAVANGPGTAGQCNQVDADGDGFGNTCDGDFNNDNVVTGADFSILLAVFGTTDPVSDLNCDGVVTGGDFSAFLSLFGGAPGPGATAI